MSNVRHQLGEICEIIKSNSGGTVQNTSPIGKYIYIYLYIHKFLPHELFFSFRNRIALKKLHLLEATKQKYTCLYMQC